VTFLMTMLKLMSNIQIKSGARRKRPSYSSHP
jgi:hypothetical protein